MLNTLFNTSHTILMCVMVKGKPDPLLSQGKILGFYYTDTIVSQD